MASRSLFYLLFELTYCCLELGVDCHRVRAVLLEAVDVWKKLWCVENCLFFCRLSGVTEVAVLLGVVFNLLQGVDKQVILAATHHVHKHHGVEEQFILAEIDVCELHMLLQIEESALGF